MNAPGIEFLRRPIRPAPLVVAARALILGLMVGLGACDDAPDTPTVARPVDTTKIPVVATAYPLADIARRVGGQRIDLTWWFESGQSPLGFEPSRAQVEQLFKAGVVLGNSSGEEFVTRYFNDGGFNERRILRLDRHAAQGATGDPQQWLNPAAVKVTVSELALRLSVMRPDERATFDANAATLTREIDTLIDDHHTRLIGLSGKTVGAIGRDYAALLRPLECACVVLSDEPAVRLTDDALRKARRRAGESGAIMILVEADTPPAVLRQIQQQFEQPLVTIDSMGTSSSAGRNTYDQIMRFNYLQLYEGWRRSVGGG